MPTKEELKYLSSRRLEAAEVLLQNGIHDIAYHDSGYILEFGFKAVICNRLAQDSYPEHDRKYRTHHFDSLVEHAGLIDELAKLKARDREFMKNWSIATKWSVELRYRPIGKDVESVATTFLNAVKSEEDGVFPWIKKHW